MKTLVTDVFEIVQAGLCSRMQIDSPIIRCPLRCRGAVLSVALRLIDIMLISQVNLDACVSSRKLDEA